MKAQDVNEKLSVLYRQLFPLQISFPKMEEHISDINALRTNCNEVVGIEDFETFEEITQSP